jgi:hypothetical protein
LLYVEPLALTGEATIHYAEIRERPVQPLHSLMFGGACILIHREGSPCLESVGASRETAGGVRVVRTAVRVRAVAVRMLV